MFTFYLGNVREAQSVSCFSYQACCLDIKLPPVRQDFRENHNSSCRFLCCCMMFAFVRHFLQ